MGAIAGVWRWDGAPLNAAELQPALQKLRQECGTRVRLHCQDQLGLLYAPGQPAPGEEAEEQPLRLPGGICLADARVDAPAEVLQRLGTSGPNARQWSDSRLLAEAWQHWSDAALRQVPGAYAGVWWHAAENRLSLFRDSMGERALYYALSPGQIAFASHLPHLLQLPAVRREPDPAFLAGALLRNFLAGHQTAWRDVYRLPPGEVLCVDSRGRRHASQPFDWRCIEAVRLARHQDYAEGLQAHLQQAVRRRLRGSSGAASYLSSGIDSSAVSAVAAAQLAAQGQALTSYTWAPQPGPQRCQLRGRHLDEAPLARSVARMYPNIDHQLIAPQPGGLCRFMDQQLDWQQQPVFNLIANKWAATVLEDASQRGLGLLLSGLAGNAAFSAADPPNLWPRLLRLQWLQAGRETRGRALDRDSSLFRALASGLAGPLRNYRRLPGYWLGARAAHVEALGQSSFARLDWLRSTGALETLLEQEHWLKWRLGVPEPQNLAGRLGFAAHSTWLANEWQQRMELAHGVATRDPTLDRELVTFVLGTPREQLRHQGRHRALVRSAMRGLLPDELLDCRTRGLPNHDWAAQLRADLPDIRERIEAMPTAVADIIDQNKMRAACEQIESEAPLALTDMGKLYSDFTMALEIAAFLERSLRC